MIDFSEIRRRIAEGIPLEELEARLRPKEPEFRDGEWSDTSGGGFLAPDESLMDVVRADYDTLCSLGKTYEQMAQLAANVLEQASRESYSGGNRLTEGIRRLLARKVKPLVDIDRKRFELVPTLSFGSQSCPWGCSEMDESGYRPYGSGHIYVMERGKGKWELAERYNNGEKDVVEFGDIDRIMYLSAFTVVTYLTPHLIASHYFFEGDASYRTDPRKLLQVAGMG